MIESTCKAGLRKHPLLLPFQQDRLCFAILYVSVSEKMSKNNALVLHTGIKKCQNNTVQNTVHASVVDP
jgi:hypothetical protein